MSLYNNLIKTEIYRILKNVLFTKARSKYSDLHEYKDIIILYEKIIKENIKNNFLNIDLENFNLKNIKLLNKKRIFEYIETNLKFKEFKNILTIKTKIDCDDCSDYYCDNCSVFDTKGFLCFLDLRVLKIIKKFTLNVLTDIDDKIKIFDIINFLKISDIDLYNKLYNSLLYKKKNNCGYVLSIYLNNDVKNIFDVIYFKKNIENLQFKILFYYYLNDDNKYVFNKIKNKKKKIIDNGLYVNFKKNIMFYYMKNCVILNKHNLGNFLIEKIKKDNFYIKYNKIKYNFDFKDLMYNNIKKKIILDVNNKKFFISHIIYKKSELESNEIFLEIKKQFYISNYEIIKLEWLKNYKIINLIEINKNDINWITFINNKKLKYNFVDWFIKNLKDIKNKNKIIYDNIVKTFKYLSLSELLNIQKINYENLKKNSFVYEYNTKHDVLYLQYNNFLDDFMIDIINIKQIIFKINID